MKTKTAPILRLPNFGYDGVGGGCRIGSLENGTADYDEIGSRADRLGRRCRARLILTGRSGRPDSGNNQLQVIRK